MQFKFPASDLRSTLAFAESLTEERSPLPALSHVLLDVTPSLLTISATDFRSTLIVKIAVDTSDTFSILVPGKTLSRWIARLPDSVVTATLNSATLRLKCASSTLTLKTMPSSEYPALSFSNLVDLGALDTAPLILALKKAAISADPSDALPMRNAVLISGFDVVATDGTRLSHAILPTSLDAPRNILIPRGVLPDLWRALASADSVLVRSDDRRLVFETDSMLYAVQTVDSEYINWNAFFTNPIIDLVSVPTSDFRSAILRISETTTEALWVHFWITPTLLTLDNLIQGNDAITHGVESISITSESEWELHLNLTYIKDILTVVTSPEVQIGRLPIGNFSMFVVKDGDTATFLIAPMSLGGEGD